MSLSIKNVERACERIKGILHQTPILSSSRLNQALGHQIFFKAENFQKTGSFKSRGAYNALSQMSENRSLPKKLIVYSSGNHSQAMAWAAQQFQIPIDLYMMSSASKVKIAAASNSKAHLIFKDTRLKIEESAQSAATNKEGELVGFDHEFVISGHGTACYEALNQLKNQNISTVFAPLGGGGLLSGTLISAKGINPAIQVFAGEPLVANDGARTLRSGKIFRWKDEPPTIADGLQTLSLTQRTFHYLKMLNGVFEITEDEIVYWTQWISHLLKIHLEPSGALGMCAAWRWLTQQYTPCSVLVILSGGNFDSLKAQKIWEKEWLQTYPDMHTLKNLFLKS